MRMPCPPIAAYGVGHNKVLRAIDILRQEGTVFAVSRPGTYVSPDAK